MWCDARRRISIRNQESSAKDAPWTEVLMCQRCCKSVLDNMTVGLELLVWHRLHSWWQRLVCFVVASQSFKKGWWWFQQEEHGTKSTTSEHAVTGSSHWLVGHQLFWYLPVQTCITRIGVSDITCRPNGGRGKVVEPWVHPRLSVLILGEAFTSGCRVGTEKAQMGIQTC